MQSEAKRPLSAILLTVCGVILVGIGLYFILIRPAFLPEDARYTGASLAEIQVVAPNIAQWLGRVFWVLGGYIVATGILTIYLAMSPFRKRMRGAALAATLAGIASIGLMATVNIVIDSDFKWPILGVATLWAVALTLFWRGK
jgi:hypothetical protein